MTKEEFPLTKQTDAMAQKYPEWFEIPAAIASIDIFKSGIEKVTWVLEQLEKQPPMALCYIVDACVMNPYTIELVDRSAKAAAQRLRAELSAGMSAANAFHFTRLLKQYEQVIAFADARLVSMGQRHSNPTSVNNGTHYTTVEQEEIYETWASTQDPALLDEMMADLVAEQTFPPQKPTGPLLDKTE